VNSVIYTITNVGGTDEDSRIELFVPDIRKHNQLGKETAVDPDEFFLDVMTRADTLHDAVRQLLSLKLNDEPVFRMKFSSMDPNYQVECMLVGEIASGDLPPRADRLFSVGFGGRWLSFNDASIVRDKSVSSFILHNHGFSSLGLGEDEGMEFLYGRASTGPSL
jgi:hypothetical protein